MNWFYSLNQRIDETTLRQLRIVSIVVHIRHVRFEARHERARNAEQRSTLDECGASSPGVHFGFLDWHRHRPFHYEFPSSERSIEPYPPIFSNCRCMSFLSREEKTSRMYLEEVEGDYRRFLFWIIPWKGHFSAPESSCASSTSFIFNGLAIH